MQLILSLALLLQQETPEKVYQSIEEVFEKSLPIRITYKMNSSNKYSDGTLRTTERLGTILLQEGNKARIEVKEATTCTVPHPRNETVFISDGRRMRRIITAEGKVIESRERDTPKNLSLLLAIGLIRQGDWSPLTRFLLDRFDPVLPLMDLEHGADEGNAKTLHFMLGGAGGTKARLWYDPKDFRILKQTWTLPGSGLTQVQVFEEFALRATVPNETFALPASEPPPPAEQILKSRISETKHDLSVFSEVLGVYRVHAGSLPSTAQGLGVLYGKPRQANVRWECPYLWSAESIKDPWGHEYVYRYPGTRNPKGFDLFSCGPDGKPDTADDIDLKDGGR